MNSTDDLGLHLAGRLRTLRKAAGLSQAQMADHLDATQSKTSKIETGRVIPTERDILDWAKATDADTDTTAELLALAAEARSAEDAWDRKFRRGQSLTQQEYDRLAKGAAVVRNFETAAIPGLLQTAEYAVLRIMEGVRRQGANPSPDEIDKAARARLDRAAVLQDASKLFVFILAEPVLRWRLAPAAVLRDQLARLLTSSEMPNVTINVLPFTASLDDTPQHGFILFDDVAIAETLTSEEVCRDAKARKYADVFADFTARSVTGDEARRLIVAAMRALD